MRKKQSFTHTFLFSIVIITVMAVGVIGFFLISDEYSRFKEQSIALKSDFIDSQKALIKDETEKVIDYIEYKKTQTVQRLKQDIKTRAKDLVRQILAFSRQGDLEQKPIQIQPIAMEALKLLRASLPATIQIRQHITKEPAKIMADFTQVHQVLMNLCTNAHHAMQEQGVYWRLGSTTLFSI